MPKSRSDSKPSGTASPAPDADPLRVPRGLANDGDLVGVMQWIAEHPPGASDLHHYDQILVRGIAVASQQSPRRFTATLHRSALAFLGYARMRLQLIVTLRLGEAGANSLCELPSDELGRLLTQIERVMRLEQDLALSWATTSRRWQLERRRRRKDIEEYEDADVRASNEWYERLVRNGVLPEVRTR